MVRAQCGSSRRRPGASVTVPAGLTRSRTGTRSCRHRARGRPGRPQVGAGFRISCHRRYTSIKLSCTISSASALLASSVYARRTIPAYSTRYNASSCATRSSVAGSGPPLKPTVAIINYGDRQPESVAPGSQKFRVVRFGGLILGAGRRSDGGPARLGGGVARRGLPTAPSSSHQTTAPCCHLRRQERNPASWLL